jgi:ficolin
VCLSFVDCKAIYDDGIRTDGIYSISPKGGEPFEVFCDMTGGGWTVLQRRFDGSLSFVRNYTDYVHGFGNISGEYWLGLEQMHKLTTIPGFTNTLRIDVHYFNGTPAYEIYPSFAVGDSSSEYMLHVSRANVSTLSTGLVNENLYYHNGSMFSTPDHDVAASRRCVNDNEYSGGWWYKACTDIHLNGVFGDHGLHGIHIDNGVRGVNPSMRVMRN